MSSTGITPVAATIYPDYTQINDIPIENSPAPGTPAHVAIDSQGRIYVANYMQVDKVHVFDRAGNSIANITYPAPASVPMGVAAYEDLVYVTETSTGNLSVYQNNVLVNSSLVGATNGVETDSDGNVYVVSGAGIKIYSPSLILLDTILAPSVVNDVAIGPDGRIFASTWVDDNVTIFGPNHQIIGAIGQTGSGPGDLDSPYGVAVNLQGYVFIADGANGRVQIFSPGLQVVGTINGFNGPFGVEVDNTGRLYVTSEVDNNLTIWKTSDLGDHEGPVITNIQIEPLNPLVGQTVNLTATITDLSGVNNATVTYSAPGVNSTTLIMSGSGDTYSVILPAFAENTTVTFSIWAEDDSFNHHTTTTTSAQHYNVLAEIPPPPAYLLPIDPTILGVVGVGLGGLGLILGLMSLTRKPGKGRK